MMKSAAGAARAVLFVALAIVLSVSVVCLTAAPAEAGTGTKITKIGTYLWKQYVKSKKKEVEKKQKVERAKQYQKFRRDEDDWRLDCCELLKERIRKNELTIEDMIKIRDFIDWRLPKNSIYKRKQFNWKNITQEVGYKIISDELCEFDLRLIYEKIKNPDYKPHWLLSIWIALGDYGRECMMSPMTRPKAFPGPGVGVGM